MTAFNSSEYGQVIRVNLGLDISSGTSLTVNLEPQVGPCQEKTSNVAVGTSDVTVDDQLFLSNQYLEYTIQEDDFNVKVSDYPNTTGFTSDTPYIGEWRARGSAIVSAVKTQGDYARFTVLA